jgi:hypothetical protein
MTRKTCANNALNFNFYADPGHAWLAVKRAELLNLGLTALSISACSYQQGGMVYLEEDCDAPYFLTALKQAGTDYHITEKSSDRTSKIRNFANFALTEAELRAIKAATQTTWLQVDSLLMAAPNTHAMAGVGQ